LKVTSVNWAFDGCNKSLTGNMEDTKKKKKKKNYSREQNLNKTIAAYHH